MGEVRRFVRTLSIEYNTELVPPDGLLVCREAAAPLKAARKDPAGHAFHAFARKQSGFFEPTSDDEEDAESPEAEPAAANGLLDDQPPPGTSWKRTGKKKKKSEKTDLYALLGLENVRWMATEQQIKNAYRKKALILHPDKAGEAATDKFKAVQEAHDILSDPSKRREYDSTDDFDDTLPIDCAPEDFYKVFGPAFRRNARWSVAQPAPDLGEDELEWEKVDQFYTFWFQFKSWREFPHPDEEDTEQADSREERRWIEKYNAKLREVGKKEERRRLKEFINAAYELDPRVERRKQEKKAEREKRKNEKAAAARQKAEEAERDKREAAERAQAEEARAQEEAAEQRKVRQREKKAMQKERQLLRKACADLVGADDPVEDLCAKMCLEGLQALNQELYAEGITGQQRLALVTDRLAELEEAKQMGEVARREAKEGAARNETAAKRQAVVAKAKEWSDEEVRLLEKALTKFPVGTARRWEQVTMYVRTRTQEEVTEMAKVGLKARTVQPQGFTVVKKRQGNTTIKDAATTRLEAFTDVDVNLSGAAVTALANGSAHAPVAVATSSPDAPGPVGVAKPKSSPETPGPTTPSPVAPPPVARQPLEDATPPAATPDAAPPVATPAASKLPPKAASAAKAAPKPAAAAAKASASPSAAKAKAGPAAPTKPAAAAAAAAPQEAVAEASAKATANGSAVPAVPHANGKCVAPPVGGVWTQVEDVALVQALKEVGKDDPERWDKVAAIIGTRSKVECMRHFKDLRGKIKAKKETA